MSPHKFNTRQLWRRCVWRPSFDMSIASVDDRDGLDVLIDLTIAMTPQPSPATVRRIHASSDGKLHDIIRHGARNKTQQQPALAPPWLYADHMGAGRCAYSAASIQHRKIQHHSLERTVTLGRLTRNVPQPNNQSIFEPLQRHDDDG